MIDKLFVVFCCLMMIVGFVLAFFCGDSLPTVVMGAGIVWLSVIVFALTR